MFFLIATFAFCSIIFVRGLAPANERPIIGILTEETSSKYAPNATSSMYASYVKYLESGGARVVPIWVYRSQQYYEDIMSKINGVLFPGGGVSLQSNGYSRSGRIILNIATKMNDKGDFFPLWGTCLGFELLNYLAVKKDWMKACSAEDLATNIELTEDYKSSRLFSDLEGNLESSMKKKEVAVHYHQWCFTPKNYSISGLNKFFKVLAMNRDTRNVTFVSVVEAYKYPFYGVAFHPEKVMFEWAPSKSIPHNVDAIRTSHYFANFFVNEARKNNHHFPNKAEEDAVLIYNFNPLFTGKYNRSVEQEYYFE